MKKLLLIAMCTLALIGCEAPEVDTLANQPIVVKANANQLVATEASSSDYLSTLGVSICNPASAEHSYTNVKYIRRSGLFTAAGGETIPFWQNATQAVQVTAYAPYQANWTGEQPFAVAADQTTDAAYYASDLLWAQDSVQPSEAHQTGSITYHDEALHVRLQHQLAKLVVNLRYLDEIDADVVADSLTVKTLAIGCTFDADHGTLSAITTPADIRAHKHPTAPEGYDACFEAIFPPQQTTFKLVIMMSNAQDFVYYNPLFTFLPNVASVLNLTVGKDKVTLTGESITVYDWDHVAGGKLETDD